ncbi:MAG: hypothetical protein C0467_23105 [Planctomycetaceae bacterium]|nr:hypothetical protein [Planctomycetaceae bacterium]
MLIASLILSGILLLAVNVAARYAENPVGVAVGWAISTFVLFGSGMCMVVFPPVLIQAGILTVGVLVAASFGNGVKAIRPLSILSVLIAYGILCLSFEKDRREQERLLTAYPMESLEERLPYQPQASAGNSSVRLDRLESLIDDDRSYRTHALQRLHDGTVTRFVDRAGFGVGRMVRVPGVPAETSVKPEPREDSPQQPDYFRPTLPDPTRWPTRPTSSALDGLHEKGILDFVNPRGFGYVKDRRHVAGFQSHGFTRVPDSAGEWKVASLDLVGLLRHDEPRVYVSAKLPRMDELREAPTRPLDPFETTALTALRGGADMHTTDGSDGIRFVGAIRSARQCVDCHGGDRGALLGAFSYRLVPGR